ncbi:uri1, prefoldin-like chaperone [Chytriomyces hyalinus]|nr:uri1, prefoldin-like chaperone [Chytriomyces hyalinus]
MNIARYQQQVEQLIAKAEQDLERCKQHEQDYASLAKFLQSAPLTIRRNYNVPIGKLAFMKGHIIHTNEVLVSLGDNWFVDQSVAQAKGIVKRRKEYAADNTRAKNEEIEQLKKRLNFADTKMVDPDGDAVNEEGLKFVEIQEQEDDEGNVIYDKAALQEANQHVTELETLTESSKLSTPKKSEGPGKEMDEFDLALLRRIEELEREDGEPDVDESDKENEEAEPDEYEEGLQQFSSGLKEDDDADDFNDSENETSASESNSDDDELESAHVKPTRNEPNDAKRASTAIKPPQIKTPADIYNHMKTVKETASKLPKNNESIFWKEKIEEREPADDESDFDSDAFEDYIFGREIASEYIEKREVMLAEQKKIIDMLDDDAKERLELREEERSSSRFQSQRIGFESESLETEIRAYVEQQRREELSVPIVPPQPAKQKPIQPPSGVKPKFKPLKPKKSVSFSEELLTSEFSKSSSSSSIGQEYSTPMVAEPAPLPVAEIEPLNRVSQFKASRQGNAKPATESPASSYDTSPFKNAKPYNDIVKERPFGPTATTPETVDTPAPRVSKFKAARQAQVSEVNAVLQNMETKAADPIPSPAGPADDKKVSKFKAARQAANPPEVKAVSQTNEITPVIPSPAGLIDDKKVSKFKAGRQASEVKAVSQSKETAAGHSVPSPVGLVDDKKVSKFKAARQASNPSDVKAVLQNTEPEVTQSTPSPAVLMDEKKVSKFKAARQAANSIEVPANTTEGRAAANIEERPIKDTVLERGPQFEDKADNVNQPPAAKKSLFRERIQK